MLKNQFKYLFRLKGNGNNNKNVIRVLLFRFMKIISFMSNASHTGIAYVGTSDFLIVPEAGD